MVLFLGSPIVVLLSSSSCLSVPVLVCALPKPLSVRVFEMLDLGSGKGELSKEFATVWMMLSGSFVTSSTSCRAHI